MSAERSTWQRRALSLPGVFVGLLVVLPLLVVVVPLLFVHDVVRYRRLPTVRLLLFGVCYLAWEVLAVLACGALWVMAGFGTQMQRPSSQRAHTALQRTWVNSLLSLAEPLLGLRFDVTGADALADGPLVLLCRHTSLVDTLIPAKLLDFDEAVNLTLGLPVVRTSPDHGTAFDIAGKGLANPASMIAAIRLAAELVGQEAFLQTKRAFIMPARRSCATDRPVPP
jgi:hypothetical protein